MIEKYHRQKVRQMSNPKSIIDVNDGSLTTVSLSHLIDIERADIKHYKCNVKNTMKFFDELQRFAHCFGIESKKVDFFDVKGKHIHMK